MKIYLAGRLRDPTLPELAQSLRKAGYIVFDDWHAAHPDADDVWRDYEIARGRTYADAMEDSAFRECVRDFDLGHLRQSDVLVIVGALSTSTAIEMGYANGTGISVIWLLPSDPTRWDFMPHAAIVRNELELLQTLRDYSHD